MAFNFLRKQSVVDINYSGKTSALSSPVQHHKVCCFQFVYVDGVHSKQSILVREKGTKNLVLKLKESEKPELSTYAVLIFQVLLFKRRYLKKILLVLLK